LRVRELIVGSTSNLWKAPPGDVMITPSNVPAVPLSRHDLPVRAGAIQM
jgi:hypothetical protein